jgi:hypothetical protein
MRVLAEGELSHSIWWNRDIEQVYQALTCTSVHVLGKGPGAGKVTVVDAYFSSNFTTVGERFLGLQCGWWSLCRRKRSTKLEREHATSTSRKANEWQSTLSTFTIIVLAITSTHDSLQILPQRIECFSVCITCYAANVQYVSTESTPGFGAFHVAYPSSAGFPKAASDICMACI